jgi:hypothetical protein
MNSSVINLSEFREWRGTPTLVLVDLHHSLNETPVDDVDLTRALANCRVALAHARVRGFPVAFFRQIETPKFLGASVRVPSWLPGFEPRRADMVFDRSVPSCYGSPEFVEMSSYTGGSCVIAGLFGESSCLSTMVDAFHRGHAVTYLADASASRTHDGIPSETMHNAITSIASLYGKVASTQKWIRLTSQRAEAVG